MEPVRENLHSTMDIDHNELKQLLLLLTYDLSLERHWVEAFGERCDCNLYKLSFGLILSQLLLAKLINGNTVSRVSHCDMVFGGYREVPDHVLHTFEKEAAQL